MIGMQLGRWIIDRQLGRGAMGSVYFAHAADAPNEVRAIKVLAADLARDPVARQRFQRETEVLCQLDHPNIVRFDGASFEGETLYYVMEYIDGPDCETRLRELKRWPWWEVIDLTIQVARGLKFAHDQGVVHRDLKPANILLAREVGETKADETVSETKSGFVAKIADFGVARVFSQGQLTGSGHLIGTALYMAPEQAAGKPATKRSDFYALGCVMYTLLTGRPPFNGLSLGELVHKHQFAQPERPSRLLPDLPHDVDELIVQLLAKDPSLRPADGSVLLKRLESMRGKLKRKHNLTGSAFLSAIPRPSTPAAAWAAPEGGSNPNSGVEWSKAGRAVLLLAALALVMGLIVWKLSQPRATADEMFDQARPLMKSSNPDEWEKAWNEYLEPMMSRFPNHGHEREIEDFRTRVDDAVSLRRALPRSHRGPPRSEAQRFFELGLQRCQSGDIDGGRKIWTDLITVFGALETERPWVALAQRGLRDVQPHTPAMPGSDDVKSALAQARKLNEEGKRDKAEAIWKGLEDLYGNDPGAEAIRATIRADRARKP